MIFLGIVGAETPMGKLARRQLAEDERAYKIVFTVDDSYQESQKDARFNNADNALVSYQATIVLDFADTKNIDERVKTYLWYNVPAIIYAAEIDDDTMERIQALRRAGQRSIPRLIVERELSLTTLLALEQLNMCLKVFGQDVSMVYLSVFEAGKDVFMRYLPVVKKINCLLGVNEQAFQPQIEATSYEHGLVRVEVLSQSIDLSQGTEKIRVEIARNEPRLGVSNLVLNFDSRPEDIGHGLKMLIDFVAYRQTSEDWKIKFDLLPQLLRQCY